MVLALLAGTKTQTRRIVKPPAGVPDVWIFGHSDKGRARARCPYGVVGDRLWVRETWAADESLDLQKPSDLASDIDIEYLADGRRVKPQRSFDLGKTRVSIFMPRWASRITLDITNVRVERVQDISEEDAKSEGLSRRSKDGGRTWKWGIPDRDGLPGIDDDGWPWQEWERSARDAYAKLWAKINGPESWASNPWTWALTFQRVTP